jgi:hypothetical protein
VLLSSLTDIRGRCGSLKGSASPPVFFFLFVILFLFTFQVRAEAPPYLTSLLESARQKELHKDRYWHTLLHYKKGPFGIRSLVDDPKFFLAKEGKHNPEAELEATIKGFFQKVDEDIKHPACRFIARYTWIKEKLNLDVSRLPVPECSHFEAIMNRIKPEAATLIFPTSHMNSPASMFGHTLLTIETEYRSDLLSYAINYSAVVDETFGFLYAIKGLLGFYKGYFSILPYYAKLQEYSDVNHRDIWEYPLDLNKEEVRRLLMHTYELDSIYSDYYFFDENCSYDLLFLLDAARPSLDLTDQCRWWVIPLDTIKTVKKSKLITGAVYRPSKTTKIKYLASLLTQSGQKKALSIARGDLEPERILEQKTSNDEKIRICDLATEYLQYEYAKKDLTKKPYLDRFLKTLRVRSRLGEPDEDQYRIPPPGRPDEAHHSNRFSLGIGTKGGDLFQEIKYRPAYHDLLDNEEGYKPGSQIVFGNTALRYYSSDKRLELENLDAIDIVSIAPRDAFFQPISWKIKTGLLQKRMEDREDHLVGELNPGGGVAYENSFIGLWYLMAEANLNVSGALDKGYAAGIGASTGFIKGLTDFWKIHFLTRDIYYGLGDRHNAFEIAFLQNFIISDNTSLTAGISTSTAWHLSQTEATIYWNLFF